MSFRQTVTVYRRDPNAEQYGKKVQGAEQAPFTIYASVQPTTGEDLQVLPEGSMENEVYKLYTDTELFTREDLQDADQVELFGKRFKVINIERWQNQVISHYKILVSRV
jgi:hypothetical protein